MLFFILKDLFRNAQQASWLPGFQINSGDMLCCALARNRILLSAVANRMGFNNSYGFYGKTPYPNCPSVFEWLTHRCYVLTMNSALTNDKNTSVCSFNRADPYEFAGKYLGLQLVPCL